MVAKWIPKWILVMTILHSQDMKSAAWNAQNQELEAAALSFQEECPPSNCSADGPVVRYPLHLGNKPNICGTRELALSCSGNTTVVNLFSGTYNVTRIEYQFSQIYVAFQPRVSCLRPDNIVLPNSTGTSFYYDNFTSHVWLNCSTMLTPAEWRIGPISCLREKGKFIYLVSNTQIFDTEYQNCTKFAEFRNLDWSLSQSMSNSKPDLLEAFLNWNASGIPGDCSECFARDLQCGLWPGRNKTFCFDPAGITYHGKQLAHDSSRIHRITSAIGIAVGILLIIGAPVSFLTYQKHRKEKEIRRKVEQFIKSYNATNPTRYTYNDIIKITKRFKTKLGQGGFGAVFKGMLDNGIPVAVKILKISAGKGDEFINEVSTIGRIHHVNVVRFLGFCSEGTRRALVYELMENGSLDKYIFYKQLGQVRQRRFNLDELQNMVISIAEGIEYLHQGCNQRIVHLDIKPHNILLDHNFNPKISDFGLSKICPKDQSYVTVSAARGTLSYMAPEMYSRNFGTVSYKSDVYSFGMLILEMVSGRRNNDPLTGNRSDVYFPDLLHEQLIQGEDLGIILDSQSNDVIARKLVTVALWCIKWSPTDRPTMTRVVNMLKEDVDSLPIPPKSSISSSNQDENDNEI